MVSLKAVWGLVVVLGAAMNLSYAAAGELEPGPLKPVCSSWYSLLVGAGLSPYATFIFLLILGSIIVSAATLMGGIPGFFSTTGGFLGAYTILVGAMYSDMVYVILGSLLAILGLIVAVEADRQRLREQHLEKYL